MFVLCHVKLIYDCSRAGTPAFGRRPACLWGYLNGECVCHEADDAWAPRWINIGIITYAKDCFIILATSPTARPQFLATYWDMWKDERVLQWTHGDTHVMDDPHSWAHLFLRTQNEWICNGISYHLSDLAYGEAAFSTTNKWIIKSQDVYELHMKGRNGKMIVSLSQRTLLIEKVLKQRVKIILLLTALYQKNHCCTSNN